MHLIFSLPLILIILAFLSFFISASETSIIAFSKIRLRHLMMQGVKRAEVVHRLILKSDRFITAVLIANNFVNIAISAIVTVLFIHVYGERLGVVAATIVTALSLVIFCEIIPKILAIKHTEKIALFAAPLWAIVINIFHPVIDIFSAASNYIIRLLRAGNAKKSPLISEEELRVMIEIGKEEGVLSEEERKMLHRIFEFGDTKVREVMVPKDKITAVNIKASPEELLNIFVEKGHARLPVYAGSVDHIEGIVYSHDLLYILRDKGLFLLQDLLHKPYCVSADMRVNELLRVFQANKLQISIVVDEHGKTLGLLTLEDLIEEIVGEIEEDQTMHAQKGNA
jgi:Mg2+/Co2+ transporter CorB